MSILRNSLKMHRRLALVAGCALMGVFAGSTLAMQPLLPSARVCPPHMVFAESLNTVSLTAARLIIEYNASSEDVGMQVFLDGAPWKEMEIFGPNRCLLFEVEGKGNLGRLGLTELFFETHEPEVANVPLPQFLAAFPAGPYRFIGTTTDGARIQGSAIFTHAIPAVPVVITPAEGSVQDPNNTLIAWEPVLNTPTVQIAEYQVIVERLDVSPKRVFSIHVPASVTSIMVPPQFLESGLEYKFEVLSIETGRNQTIHESFFYTL